MFPDFSKILATVYEYYAAWTAATNKQLAATRETNALLNSLLAEAKEQTKLLRGMDKMMEFANGDD